MSLAPDSGDLIERAKEALRTRDWRGALELIESLPADRATVESFLDKALAQRMLHDLEGAIASLDAALTLEPRNFLALLSKGALLERLARRKDAAAVYTHALTVAPAEGAMPAALAAPAAHAREMVARWRDDLAEHLMAAVAAVRSNFPDESLERFDESLQIFAGKARAFVQEPLLLHYPRLPAIPFYDRALFPWLAELEAATPAIQAELALAQSVRAEDFAPYIAFPPGVPVNQWGELNHSRRWNSFFLWRDGVRQEAACALCPRTAALLESLPSAEQPGFAPTAMFSVLDAGAHIPPHTGSANTRLIVHLPLVLPGPARFRVGNVTRPWRMGEAWVFDDTIEHEAWNEASAARTILIFDIWNPYLSGAEREMVGAMMTAKNDWRG